MYIEFKTENEEHISVPYGSFILDVFCNMFKVVLLNKDQSYCLSETEFNSVKEQVRTISSLMFDKLTMSQK